MLSVIIIIITTLYSLLVNKLSNAFVTSSGCARDAPVLLLLSTTEIGGVSFDSKMKHSNRLHAVKQYAMKREKYSPSGFGGAAISDCPCGSGLSFVRCCDIIHSSSAAYANATAAQVVRARYSAFALHTAKCANFLVSSTHFQNKEFPSINTEKFKQDVLKNNNFKLISCKILDETYENDDADDSGAVATVKFTVKMIAQKTKEKTGFTETSKFQRIESGPWLYLDGIVEPVEN